MKDNAEEEVLYFERHIYLQNKLTLGAGILLLACTWMMKFRRSRSYFASIWRQKLRGMSETVHIVHIVHIVDRN